MQVKHCRAKKLLVLSFFCTITILTSANASQAQQAVVNKRSLPPCRLDSFVYQAGSRAEAIYGDEGIRTPPPYFGFSAQHRIDAGIIGVRDAGLTTGHTSQTAGQDQRREMDTRMPSAWGYDEFAAEGGEWVRTGQASSNNRYSGTDDNGIDYSQEIDAYENTVEGIQNNINTINQNIIALTEQLNILSPADIKGRQDLSAVINQAYLNRTRLNSKLAQSHGANLPAGFAVGSH